MASCVADFQDVSTYDGFALRASFIAVESDFEKANYNSVCIGKTPMSDDR